MTTSLPPPPFAAPREENTRGCAWIGCAVLGVVFLILCLLAGCGAVLGYHGYRFLHEQTAGEPEEIPVYEGTIEETAAAREKLDRFLEEFDADRTAELVLSAEVINALVASDTRFSIAAGHVWFDVGSDTFGVDASIPLDGLPGFSGRFLNGRLEAGLALRDGVLAVTIESLSLKGEPVSSEVLAELRKQDIGSEIMRSPDFGPVLRRLEAIEIRDGKVVVRN